MKDAGETLIICLFGQFAVRTAAGEDLTPHSKKAMALIALLAECDSMKRARGWVERVLWSDRATEQAQGSLRQTVFEIRKRFGRYGRAVQSDRMSVWLDPEQVRIEPAGGDREFLEGLIIADPAFCDWLARKRLAYGRSEPDAVSKDRIVRIQCGLPWTATEAEPAGARIVNDHVAGIISGFIAKSKCGVLNSDADLIVRASLEEMEEGKVLAVQVIDARRDALIHSDFCVEKMSELLNGDSEALGRFCWKVADRTLDQLASTYSETDLAAMRAAWSQEAINAVLTFNHQTMPQSLDILRQATSDLDHGLFHALRAWAMMSLIMEGRLEETGDTLAYVRGELDAARQLALGDPMVNAVVANVTALLFEDYSEALRLSAAALRGQRSNIFALQAMSICRLNMGARDTAYELSRRSRIVAEATKFGAMCSLHHALMCLRTNRPAEALESSRAAAEAVPCYRAPNRQLVALYAASGQVAKATKQAVHLASIEPEFTLDRFLFDDSYPTNTLRSVGMLDRASQAIKASK